MDEPAYAMPEQMQDAKQRRETIRQALATVERADTEHLHPTEEDPANRILMKLRKEIVEHPFGIIKAIDGFGRFTVRGLAAANAQWALVCSAYNLRKMYAFWLQGEMNLGGC
jgi:hypothetical protein